MHVYIFLFVEVGDKNIFLGIRKVFINFQPYLKFDVKIAGWVGIFLIVKWH